MATELMKNDPAKAGQYFRNKMAFTTGPVELSSNLKQGTNLAVIDVRDEKDFRNGHIPGAVNLPRDKWGTAKGLRKGALNVLVCYTQQCHLAATAAIQFAAKGYSVMEMEGGFEAWKANKLEIETKSAEQHDAASVKPSQNPLPLPLHKDHSKKAMNPDQRRPARDLRTTATRDEVRKTVHRANVPRQSMRPTERSK